MNWLLIRNLFFVLFLFQNPTCVWYGVCKNTQMYKTKYCSYNETAKPLNDEGIKLLTEHCPHLVTDKTLTCCDNEQVITIS